MNRIEKSMEYHKGGYNCAQAVVCSFLDKLSISEKDAFKLSEALGFGDSDSFGTCGAVSGMALVIGMANSTGNLEKPDSKAATGKLSREISRRFMERNQTVTCKVLKGVGTGEMIRTCPDCIRDAAEFLEQVVFAEK